LKFHANSLLFFSYFPFFTFFLSPFFSFPTFLSLSLKEKYRGEKEDTKKNKSLLQCSVKKGGKEKPIGGLVTNFLQNFQSLLQNFQPVVQHVGNILQSWTPPYVMVKHKTGLWVNTEQMWHRQ